MKDRISPIQFVSLAFVSALSPFIRRFPCALALIAGRTAWLSVVFAAVFAVVIIALLTLLSRRFPGPLSLNAVFCRAVGRVPGGALSLIYSLFLILYSGAALRFFAARFVSTVYSGTSPALFIVVMGLSCAVAAMGQLKAIARSAMVSRIVMAAVLTMIILFSLTELDFRILLPVTTQDIAPNLIGGAETVNVLCITSLFAFAGDRLERGIKLRDYMLWLVLALVFMELLCLCCVATFGPALTASMSFPVFMLTRDITVLGSVERIEALIIAVWVLSDFVLISAFLHLAGDNLKTLFSFPTGGPRRALSDMSDGRWLTLAASAAAIAAALLLGRSHEDYHLLSEELVPVISAAASATIALMSIIAAVRRK